MKVDKGGATYTMERSVKLDESAKKKETNYNRKTQTAD